MQLLSTAQLRKALAIREQIESLEMELNSIMEGSGVSSGKRGRRKMSASARAKIAAGQKARWVRVKGVEETNGATPVKSKRRKMSPAARAKIAAAARARWKKAKAAGKSSL
jgi:hypothetical protein